MHRRHATHDYQGIGIYMITIETRDRRPILGRLSVPPNRAHSSVQTLESASLSVPPNRAHSSFLSELPRIQLSTIGSAVVRSWQAISQWYPQIHSRWLTVMPDHLHGVLYVKDRIPVHLGKVIAAFKRECNRDAYKALETEGKLESARSFVEFADSKVLIWKREFNDIIIRNPEQLQNSIAYLKDNPRRLWLKQQHAEYFAQLEVKIAGQTFNSVGNIHLLSADRLLPVHISSRQTESAIQQQIQALIAAAQQGTVLVSPFISEGEKAVEKALAELNLPHVKLLENGFGEFFKPAGKAFDACAEGMLLLLAPWEHHNDQRRITRAQCLALNQMAADICQASSQAVN